jgi:hypothetical protein
MYYNPAKSTSIPELIQSVGRLCGRNKGKSHLHLHTTNKVATALWNGVHFTNEAINRAIASPLMNLAGEEMSFGDSIKSVPMLKKKMPVGRNLTNKIKVLKKDFNQVTKDDGGESLESYKYKVVAEPVDKIVDGDLEGDEIFICKDDLPPTNHELYDYAVNFLKKNKNTWIKKATIFTTQRNQNTTQHWAKYSKTEGKQGLFIRKKMNNWEMKYI